VFDASVPQQSRDASVEPTDAAVLFDAAALDAGLPPHKWVFTTSGYYSAALGGLTGADSICQQHAFGAGLAGQFKSWLSSVDTPVGTRFVHAELPYYRVDGVRVADDWDDLLDGELAAPISNDEDGNSVGGDVWTGTLADGNPWPDDDCMAFTVDDETLHAACGSSTSTGGAWTDSLRPNCSTFLHLYCIEQ
jgi:hypothetical protein